MRGSEGVFETKAREAFHFTPWERYQKWIDTGRVEVKIVRFPALDEIERVRLNEYLTVALRAPVPYDMLGALSLIFDMVFRYPLFRAQSKRRWFCTEVVDAAYAYVGKRFLGDSFPSPHAIEQKVKEGVLVEVADYYRIGYGDNE